MGELHNLKSRLTVLASGLWIVDWIGQKPDNQGGIVMPRATLRGHVVVTSVLNQPRGETMVVHVRPRCAIHLQGLQMLYHLLREASRWLQWWRRGDQLGRQIREDKHRLGAFSTEECTRVWRPLRMWMGELHMGLHDSKQ